MKKVNIFSAYIFTTVFFVSITSSLAQGFKASLVTGLNLAQIDGDTLYGFNMQGLTAGIRLMYDTKTNRDISIEMLYSERGAKQFFFDQGRSINLSYLEVPIIYSFRDWYIEDKKFFRVRGEVGITNSLLFRTRSNFYDEENFKDFDFGWLLGAGFNFTKRIGLGIRYSSSLLNLSKNENTKLKSYFLTIRGEYNF